MKRETKLRIRKRMLMWLSALVWRLDEWVHAEQTKLQKELAEIPTLPTSNGEKGAQRESARTVPMRPRETFQQWEARKSGVAVISKKEARRRRETTAAAFDLRFAR